jgi:aldose sugar dehydrogenase
MPFHLDVRSASNCVVMLAFVLASGPVRAQVFPSSLGPLRVETVVRGLERPWSLAFLPDGRMLVTERPGRMRIATLDGGLSPPLAGVPQVYAWMQSGLLDVALDRNYAQNNTIFFCFNADQSGAVSVARATLRSGEDLRLDNVSIIFRQEGPPPIYPGHNTVCRILQWTDGNLFISLGDHYDQRVHAQNLGNHLGKIIRIRPDGSVPPDNPFVTTVGAKPEIWSFGHRNPEGLVRNPDDGRLWEQEHGPQGGDEINIIEKGRNYGWPVITHGKDYDNSKIGIGTWQDGMEQPVWHWTQSIAPSGMTFYSGRLWPGWRGSLFNGALQSKLLSRLDIAGDQVISEEQLLIGLNERIRDVREGPDGALWLLTDNKDGRILRLAPDIGTGTSIKEAKRRKRTVWQKRT